MSGSLDLNLINDFFFLTAYLIGGGARIPAQQIDGSTHTDNSALDEVDRTFGSVLDPLCLCLLQWTLPHATRAWP